MNKKAQNLNVSLIIGFVVLAVLLIIAVVPLIKTQTETGELECTNSTIPFFNESNSLCIINATADETVNGTQTFVKTLSPSERTVMGLIVLFLILGLVFAIAKMSGLIGKK